MIDIKLTHSHREKVENKNIFSNKEQVLVKFLPNDTETKKTVEHLEHKTRHEMYCMFVRLIGVVSNFGF